jgi:molybdopterin/thiamine biosynthesis adenylyltransferase
MSRYDRQIAVPGMGAAGQARLARAHLLVIGAGGLGAAVLPYLAGAGVGRIRLVDPDIVEESNLHRQVIFRAADLGRPKAEAAAAHLRALNPETVVEPLCARFDPASAAALCAGVDLVLDCADSFAASYVASDHCMAAGLPLVSASATGRAGYAGGFCGGAPSLRAVFPDLPARLGSCASEGVLGPVVGTIGGVQAQMALAIAAGLDPAPLGRLVSFDAASWRMGGFGFAGAPEPARAPRFVAASQISPGDYLVDLRARDEPGPPLPGAARLTVEDFGPGGLLPPQGARAVLACRSGLRAWRAAARLGAVWEGEIALLALGP